MQTKKRRSPRLANAVHLALRPGEFGSGDLRHTAGELLNAAMTLEQQANPAQGQTHGVIKAMRRVATFYLHLVAERGGASVGEYISPCWSRRK